MKTSAPLAPAAARPVRITRPGDALERDADRMADAALVAGPVAPTALAPPATVMRQATAPDFEEDDDFDIAAAAGPGGPLPAPHGFLDAVRSSGGGHGLAAPQQARFEQGFGRPLDHVRIHDDAAAARLADRINARAFTHGADVFFAHGEHRPGPEGDRLLAHELAHTLQRPGPGTVARKPKKSKPGKPTFDPSRMTDEEKLQKRQEIYNEAVDLTDTWYDQFKDNPAVNAAQRETWTKALDDAIVSAQGISDQHQREVRLAFLQAERDLFKDDFIAWTFQQGYMEFDGGTAGIASVGNPAKQYSETDLTAKAARTGVMRAGARPYLIWVNQRDIYKEQGINPKDLETEEKTEQELSGAMGAPTAGTTTGADAPQAYEDRKVLEEMDSAFADLATDSPTQDDRKLLAAELRKLTKEQRKDFYAFTRQLVQSSPAGGQPQGLLRAMELFNTLDSASREALAVNRKMREAAEPGTQEGLPKKVLLDIKTSAAEGQEITATARAVNDNLELIQKLTRDPAARNQIKHALIDLDLFHTEITMIRGLLLGGMQGSPLVEEVCKQLISEIAHIEDRLLDQLKSLLAELLAAELFAALTEGLGAPAVAVILERVNELRKLLERLRRAYDTYKRIEQIVGLVKGLSGEYRKLLRLYDRASALYATLEKELEKIESAEDLEQALEAEEEKLFSELETLLEDKLGALLEMLYIPADASYEEVRQILVNIPTGLSALAEMWSFYRGGNKDDPHFEETLGIKATYAGALLFPFVGLLAALIAKGIEAAFSGSSIRTRIDKLFATREGGKTGSILDENSGEERHKRNRGLFGRVLRRRAEDYDTDSFKGELAEARKRLDGILETEAAVEDEPSHHWAPAWFKLSVRSGLKEVNRQFQAEKRTVLSADKTTQIPVPRLHVHISISRSRTDRTMTAVLSGSSPKSEPIKKYEYSYDDFKGNGVNLKSKDSRRRAAIRRWLSDEGYLMITNEKRKEHLRLPGAKEQSKSGGAYLHIDNDRVKQEIDPDAYRDFIGREIVESNQLPEGYYMVSLHGEDTVSLKKHLKPAGLTTLGIESDRKLIAGKPTMPPKTIAKGDTVKPEPQHYKYLEALDNMFTRKPGTPTYKTEGQSRDWWLRQVNKTPGLQTRPKRAKGKLGYVLRARAYGSRDLHTPELRADDDVAHMIAMRFGGADDYDNVVPMLSKENRYDDKQGRWYDLEDEMADVYKGSGPKGAASVEFELAITYPTMTTRRPSRFVASYTPLDAQGRAVGSRKSLTIEQ
jgi:hypothetical protein